MEHLISSLKSVVSLKPLRVWSTASERGALLVGLISQLIVSVVRWEMVPDVVQKKVDGKITDVGVKPAYRTICEDLKEWKLTVEFDSGERREHESNVFGCIPRVKEVLQKLDEHGPVEVKGNAIYRRPIPEWRL